MTDSTNLFVCKGIGGVRDFEIEMVTDRRPIPRPQPRFEMFTPIRSIGTKPNPQLVDIEGVNYY